MNRRFSSWPLRGSALLLATATLLLPSTTPASSAQGETTATWPTSQSLTQGSDRYVTGTASDPGQVRLEQRVLGGWRIVGTSTTASDGSYRIKIPTWWLGSRTYRVRSETTSSAWYATRVAPTYTPRGNERQFKYSFDTMTRWNPCTTIGYRVNARQGTRGAVGDTRRAFARISKATGFRFAYRGSTRRIPQHDSNSWYPSDTQIVVAWARPSQSSLLSAYPKAAGVGSSMAYSGFFNGDGSRTNKIVKGMVVLNSQYRFGSGFGHGTTRGDLLLHEIGHSMGLSHSGATEQMMYAYLTRSSARYGKGDLHALEVRGAKLGCVQDSAPGSSARTTREVPTRVAAIRLHP
jgi:hypothetical protein